MANATPSEIAVAWWNAIDHGDFHAAQSLMAPTAHIDWPLSNERMPTPDAWRIVNENYPGRWRASIEHVIAEGNTVVTRTCIADGGISVLAISWFTIEHGVITNLVEYWPETYAAPGWRAQWVTPITRDNQE